MGGLSPEISPEKCSPILIFRHAIARHIASIVAPKDTEYQMILVMAKKKKFFGD